MKFYGLKKTTLIDYPDHVACTAFTHGCTLRCPYCHNPELVIVKPKDEDSISSDELIEFLEKRRGKLDGIVFTGGEPLLHTEKLTSLLRKIKDLDFLVKIDTNGTLPDELQTLIEEELVDFVAMDFKTDPDEYDTLGATKKHLKSIRSSLQLLKDATVDFEIRTTLVPGLHTPDTIKKMMPYVKDVDRYVLQSFAPNGTIDPTYKDVEPFTEEELGQFLEIAKKYNIKATLRN